MLSSSLVYIAVSLLGGRRAFDMDRMLHRGQYAVKEEVNVVDEVPARGWRMLGMGKEFTRGDKFIYVGAYSWTFAWTVVFVIGTYINLTSEVSDTAWMTFWRTFILINIVVSVLVIVWFAIGGTRDLKDILRRLGTMTRDHKDDGFVVRPGSVGDDRKEHQ